MNRYRGLDNKETTMSWEHSLRHSRENYSSDHVYAMRGEDLGPPARRKYPGNASSSKNVESKDYSHLFFTKHFDFKDTYMIVDPFKPNNNKWLRKQCKNKQEKVSNNLKIERQNNNNK